MRWPPPPRAGSAPSFLRANFTEDPMTTNERVPFVVPHLNGAALHTTAGAAVNERVRVVCECVCRTWLLMAKLGVDSI